MTETGVDTELERLRTVLGHIPAPVALFLGPTHVHAFVNEHYRQVSGGRRDVTGLTVREAFPEVEGQGLFEVLDTVYKTGEAWKGSEVPVRYDRKGQGLEDTWFNLTFEPLRDGEGKVIGILDYAVEVTDQVRSRREVERLLKESEQTRSELLRANEQLQEQQMEMELSNQQLQDNAMELEAQTEELQATAAQLEEAMDEADSARADSVARETEIRTLADAIPTLAWTARADGFIEWYNARWYEYTGTTPAEMAGWGWQSVHDPETLPWILDQWKDAIAKGTPTEMTFPLRSAEGEFRRFLTRIIPLRNAEGKVIRWFGTNTDVEAERAAREAAESANQAKTNFLANMSHELRTPLNAIGGYAELLELGIHGPLLEPQREAIGRIQRSQRHLLSLINEVLNFAKLETGSVHYNIEVVPIADALALAESLVIPQARTKGVNLHTESVAPELTVRADSEKLQQILLNLLSNAVKFTEPGGEITMSAELLASRVTLRISDTGIGIPDDKFETIFDPFVQVQSSLARPHEGTGLGLAISRDLARGMGGDLTVESTLGKGSTFSVTLPVD